MADPCRWCRRPIPETLRQLGHASGPPADDAFVLEASDASGEYPVDGTGGP